MFGKDVKIRNELLMLFIVTVASASGLGSISTGDIRFGIDTALFDYAGTYGLEIYQAIGIGQISSNQDSVACFSTTIVLCTTEGDTTAVDQWVSEVQWQEGRSVVNQTVLPAVPGEYELTVTVIDMGNGRQGIVTRHLAVNPQEIDFISQIELVRTVMLSPEGSTNPLRKGAYLIFPAANSSFLLPADDRLYFYLEVYPGDEITHIQTQSRLETAGGDVIFARPRTSLDIPAGTEAMVVIDSLSLAVAANQGIHVLKFEVIAGGDTLIAEKPLMISAAAPMPENYSDEADGRNTAGSEYSDEFRLILLNSELALFDRLDDVGKSEFYQAYWQDRLVELTEFELRCEESAKYSNSFRESWETDRGRVHIIYGPPEDIDTVSFRVDEIPHETWYYFVGGNNTFVFADMMGTGEFEQIYSTVEGEVSYQNWTQLLSPVNMGGGNTGGQLNE